LKIFKNKSRGFHGSPEAAITATPSEQSRMTAPTGLVPIDDRDWAPEKLGEGPFSTGASNAKYQDRVAGAGPTGSPGARGGSLTFLNSWITTS